jgi:hypothetical protein
MSVEAGVLDVTMTAAVWERRGVAAPAACRF